jgi:type IV pilus assembly protein PilE
VARDPALRRGAAGAPRPAGFTLIEAMVVLAVAAILAAIAVPTYAEHVVRAKRAAARGVLLEAAQLLERNFTAAGCYDFADVASCLARSGPATVRPPTLLRAPSDGRQSHAVVWTLGDSGLTYTLSATPCGAAGAGCPAGAEIDFVDARCGALTLTHTGLRGAGGGVAACWQR